MLCYDGVQLCLVSPGKQLSSYDMLDGVSSDSEEDSELTALLHQKVIQVSWPCLHSKISDRLKPVCSTKDTSLIGTHLQFPTPLKTVHNAL